MDITLRVISEEHWENFYNANVLGEGIASYAQTENKIPNSIVYYKAKDTIKQFNSVICGAVFYPASIMLHEYRRITDANFICSTKLLMSHDIRFIGKHLNDFLRHCSQYNDETMKVEEL